MPFLCSAVAKPTLPHCIYVGQLILTLCYLEGPTKELVSPQSLSCHPVKTCQLHSDLCYKDLLLWDWLVFQEQIITFNWESFIDGILLHLKLFQRSTELFLALVFKLSVPEHCFPISSKHSNYLSLLFLFLRKFKQSLKSCSCDITTNQHSLIVWQLRYISLVGTSNLYRLSMYPNCDLNQVNTPKSGSFYE